MAVAGAGVGGLALALALHARGIRPVVFEREAELGEAGAGVQLGPNALRVLFALGLEGALRRVGSAPGEAQVRRGRDGALLLATDYAGAERRWGAPYLQLHRADLQRSLLEAVRERDAAELRLGAPVEAASPDGTVRLGGGGADRFDVVVGADGLRSAAARAVGGDAPPRASGQVAWRATIPAERLPAELLAPRTQVRIGRGGHLVTYPLRAGALLNLVAVVEAQAGEAEARGWTQAGDARDLRAAFAGWAEPAPTLLDALAEGPLWRGALLDRAPRPRWTAGRVALLGDAAHPMLPSFAQGAAMAVEDAWVLAEALARAPVAAALADYQAARRGRTARVQAESRRNARLFHLPDAASAAAFAAARWLDRADPSGGLARFDWLYGGGPLPFPPPRRRKPQ